MTALSYLLNMGGTQNNHLIEISVNIFTVWADWTSRNLQESHKWKFCPTVLKQICSHLGKPLLDLFASRLCHQLPQYIVWQPDPQSVATGLGVPISVCIFIILNDRKSIKESSKRPDQHDYCYTCLTEPVMTSSSVENDKSSSLTKSFKSFTQ